MAAASLLPVCIPLLHAVSEPNDRKFSKKKSPVRDRPPASDAAKGAKAAVARIFRKVK